MVGTGGSALVSKTMGEGRQERANGLFSMLIWVSVGVGILLAVLGAIFMRPVAMLLGARGQMLEDCVTYGCILQIALPAFVLQNEFHKTAKAMYLAMLRTPQTRLARFGEPQLLGAIYSLS